VAGAAGGASGSTRVGTCHHAARCGAAGVRAQAFGATSQACAGSLWKRQMRFGPAITFR
jgi:hypothetical protein